MADLDQPDRFHWARQLDLFGGEQPALEPAATPEKMRAYLHELLAEARAAKTMPITADRGFFALLSFWLPEEESAQLRLEFETELARLEAA